MLNCYNINKLIYEIEEYQVLNMNWRFAKCCIHVCLYHASSTLRCFYCQYSEIFYTQFCMYYTLKCMYYTV